MGFFAWEEPANRQVGWEPCGRLLWVRAVWDEHRGGQIHQKGQPQQETKSGARCFPGLEAPGSRPPPPQTLENSPMGRGRGPTIVMESNSALSVELSLRWSRCFWGARGRRTSVPKEHSPGTPRESSQIILWESCKGQTTLCQDVVRHLDVVRFKLLSTFCEVFDSLESPRS